MNTPQDERQLKTFGWASFLNDFGSDIIFPLWPIFLTSVLGANLAVLGLIDGLGDALVSVSQAVSGFWADRIGKRKPFIWIGYACAGIARIGYALAPGWGWIIPFRALDRAGKMRGAPRDAIIADLSTDRNRGRNFGYLRMMDNLGAVCGVLFTIFFFQYLGYTTLFLIAAVPSLIGAMLIVRVIKDTKSERKIFKGLAVKDFSGTLVLVLILGSLFSLASFSYSFLLISARQLGFAVVTIPVLYLAYSAIASATSLPFGKLADRLKRKTVLAIALGLWLLVCVIFINFSSPLAAVLAFAVYGLHLGAMEPVQKALVSELAPPDRRASTLGTYQLVTGLCALPSSLLAGWLWQTVGLAAPFALSAALTSVAVLLLAFVREPNRSTTAAVALAQGSTSARP